MPGPAGSADPPGDGLDTIGELRARLPGVAAIVLTTFDSDDHVARAVRAGASGFLLKASDPRELLAAVRAVAAGEGYLSPDASCVSRGRTATSRTSSVASTTATASPL